MKKIVAIISCLVIGLSGYFFLYQPNASKPESPFKQYQPLMANSYRVGFTTLNTETNNHIIPVTGKMPEWLSGTLFRNGPAQFTSNGHWVTNWFDGLAMIHAFSFSHGIVSYANKFLRSDDYNWVKKTGKMSYAGFAQDPCKARFKQLFSWFKDMPTTRPQMPNANVNIVQYGNHFVALTETPLPIEFDAGTLDTVGVMEYQDNYPKKDIHETAHPHYDPERKEHIGYFTQFGLTSTHNVYRIADGATKREIIYSYPVKEPSYMHSFSITQKYAILTLLPLVVNPLSQLFARKAFIKNFKWKPRLGTKFVVIDRINGTLKGVYTTRPFFAFHTVNAFETQDNLVIDIIVYPQELHIEEADFATLLAPQEKKSNVSSLNQSDVGKITRFTINFSDKTLQDQELLSALIELPRINYEKINGREYRYVYAVSKTEPHPFIADTLVKLDLTTKASSIWSHVNCFPGEPVFVRDPRGKLEDDGVILSVVLDATKQTSFLLVLDARTFTELARAQVAHHIPVGIHGIYAHLN